MSRIITISLPDTIRRELDRMSQDECVSRSDIVRESMVAKASRHGVSTDQDVFDKVS
ncbi:MAG: hypothetical protein KJ964_13010 [Verrucomicrobia bacterium]|nr:hypothetical protein [Verrucomicrobiota bacterium]MBU1734429.1 hypothetical protein [Verrucomicrobiota bacterium]MBU1857335.1 hypothetical protein [Verrucomicrobiota bacterium]